MLPDTMQTTSVVGVKVIGSPELAVALSAKGATPSVTLPGAAKVMV